MAHSAMRMVYGLAAAAVAVGVMQLVAIAFGPAADARTAVGSTVIDLTPGPVKEWAIKAFATSDKLFLTVMVVVVIAALAALTAVFETRRRPVGSIALTVGGLAGGAAVLSRPGASFLDVVPTVVGAALGIVVLRFLTAERGTPDDATAGEEATGGAPPTDPQRRRTFAAVGLFGLGVAGTVVGVILTRQLHSVAGERNALPPAPPLPAGKALPPPPLAVQPAGVALPSYVTGNKDFYRIDTALNVPQVSRKDWRLKIHGMVDRDVTYTFDDLAAFAPLEKMVTLCCVSNPVGGDLISNANWTGYRVRDLLARAGIHPNADMVLSTSIDGFTAGTPVEALTDGRDAMLAITMNGEPLPIEHGYPARLVVPGLYGYVSATKWVTDLELTRFDQAQAYWTGLGWAAKGPVKTQSRVDVPKSGQVVPPGPVTFGGVAWAQNRGVKAVEVRIDDGPWSPAQLGASYTNDAWRLWSFPWQATAKGSHSISVRATDNTGTVQTSAIAPTMPDGATGWHTISFTVA
ncbi:MAG: molybdopterin-dependent oxidoreductase [Actinomycetota bacterium]|nr:molybdopterin-dependent oxidoreductase [Actinomycetota bacterium]